MNYFTFPDDQLVDFLRAGDEAAFAEIYRRYWRRLYLTARQKVSGTEVIEELLQELFVKLWERRESLLITHLEAYLFSALRYAIINHIKAKMVREQYLANIGSHQSQEEHSTEEQVALHELAQAINHYVEELPVKTKQIFLLSRMEYKTVKEIALLLQMPERTVEYHLAKAISALRLYLRDFLICCLVWQFLWLK